MLRQPLYINGIPVILWGKESNRLFIHVHGKMSRKEHAEGFAALAESRGWQTLSFDLPEHGERSDAARLDIWNGVHDLNVIADYAFRHWDHISLYACSLGAYFALNAYPDRLFEKCLFQSPIVDMQWLVEQMMQWYHVTPERLQKEGEIDTPIDPLRWDYYQYILQNPIQKWPFPTSILYAQHDDLQPFEAMRLFSERFGCPLTVSPDSGHAFMDAGDELVVNKWIETALDEK